MLDRTFPRLVVVYRSMTSSYYFQKLSGKEGVGINWSRTRNTTATTAATTFFVFSLLRECFFVFTAQRRRRWCSSRSFLSALGTEETNGNRASSFPLHLPSHRWGISSTAYTARTPRMHRVYHVHTYVHARTRRGRRGEERVERHNKGR